MSKPLTPAQLVIQAQRRVTQAQSDIESALQQISGDAVLIADLRTSITDLKCASGRLNASIQRIAPPKAKKAR